MTDDRFATELSRLTVRHAGPAPLREARRLFERTYIVAVLEQHGWHVANAARALGLQRPNLYRKARQLQIDLRRSSGGE
jgi:transcriptional regulator with GAF, ATPase, and Fis domain